MITGKDKEKYQQLHTLAIRVHEAHRWLAEFKELEPMWDYILGKLITNVNPDGSTCTIYAETSISETRDKLRKRFKKEIHE